MAGPHDVSSRPLPAGALTSRKSPGAGLLGAQQLEASTVDLSTEFTGLITTQRAYEMNSKVISTADEMLSVAAQVKS